jgi:release factor glutamine methyltransferase
MLDYLASRPCATSKGIQCGYPPTIAKAKDVCMSSPQAPRSPAAWTIRALMEWTERHFRDKAIESPRLEAQLLLAHSLECRKTDLYTRWDEAVSEERRGRFRDLIKRRLEGCPVQYLLGYRDFFLLNLEVTPAVLIPRTETELLVTEALNYLKPLSSPQVLDVGTGSGCIAIAIAHRHSTAKVTASDISGEALEVARRNADRHGVAEKIQFLQGDLLTPLNGERFDLIVSNPPYVSHAEFDELAPQVRNFEPRLALDGGADGYSIYDRLIPESMHHLAPRGKLLLEIGHAQEAGVRRRVEAAGLVADATICDDQRHPRVIAARKP